MKQRNRIVLAIVILVVFVAVILGVDWMRRMGTNNPTGTATPLPAGSIPIHLNGDLVAGFIPADLEKLKKVSFTDAAVGKLQDGWLLRDVLLLHIAAEHLTPDAVITITSTSRGKTAELSWAEVQDQANMVMFDLSNRGTLKLVSLLPRLDMRDEWVQDVDRIEISSP